MSEVVANGLKSAFVLGTRPEIIKLSPIIEEARDRGLRFAIIHTGQHYSDSLDEVFFEQLELPAPDYNLGVGSGSHGRQTGEMLRQLEPVLKDVDPTVVFVQGDTNSVLAGAIATSKLDAELAHVEAGLRSFDRDMPEETNRVVADHVADHLFTPTTQSKEHLRNEGRPPESVFVTGNTVVDALERNRTIAERKSNILAELGLKDETYFLVTAHRAENVDDEHRFRNILAGVNEVGNATETEIIYPIHPRAQERITQFDIDVPERVTVIDPVDYLDFLRLSAEADLIFTDSGGVQEEACVLGVPCVTTRDSTERPETIDVGANALSGTDAEDIRRCAFDMIDTEPTWPNPFGDGTTAEQIIDILTTETTGVGR